jgi:hypothetical protein
VGHERRGEGVILNLNNGNRMANSRLEYPESSRVNVDFHLNLGLIKISCGYTTLVDVSYMYYKQGNAQSNPMVKIVNKSLFSYLCMFK